MDSATLSLVAIAIGRQAFSNYGPGLLHFRAGGAAILIGRVIRVLPHHSFARSRDTIFPLRKIVRALLRK